MTQEQQYGLVRVGDLVWDSENGCIPGEDGRLLYVIQSRSSCDTHLEVALKAMKGLVKAFPKRYVTCEVYSEGQFTKVIHPDGSEISYVEDSTELPSCAYPSEGIIKYFDPDGYKWYAPETHKVIRTEPYIRIVEGEE